MKSTAKEGPFAWDEKTQVMELITRHRLSN